MTDAPSRDQLYDHLVGSRLAGDVATGRDSNVGNIERCLRREPAYTFGLSLDGAWTYDDVLALMAQRCGVSDDPAYTSGPDRIDPELTIARLDEMRARLAKAAADRERVLVATGHPTGVLAIHLPVAAALAAAGCTILTPAEGQRYDEPRASWEPSYREVRYFGGVGMVSNGGDLRHTHFGEPMVLALDALAAGREAPPDLVMADHGWAGAAGENGVDTVGFADCNDPALFVGEAEGKVATVVPIDDNVAPALYGPVTAYLLAALA